MFVRCIGTGSSGNSYALYDNSGKILLLDLGMSAKDIKRAIDFEISDVVGALCSHEHKDHSKSLDDFRNMGIHIMAPFEVGDVKHSHCRMGNFDITSFDLPHNGVWNSGFLIKADGQTILYMTDFEYCKYNFHNLKINHILIECNYQKDFVDRDLPQYEHKIKGHCSLDTCKEFIKANRTGSLRTVLLLHMGRDTLDYDYAVSEVKKVAGNAFVDYARAGETYSLDNNKNKCPF